MDTEPFRPIPLEEFEKLSIGERIEYLRRATSDSQAKLKAISERHNQSKTCDQK